MRIILISSFDGTIDRKYHLNDWKEIEVVFDSLDWTKFHVFTIQEDDRNSLDISGNLFPDGLSGSFTRDGEIHITPDPPGNLSEAKLILKSFLKHRNETFEKYFKEKVNPPIRIKRRDERFFRWIMILFFASLILTPIIYFSGDELNFIGRDVGFARAKVVDVKMQTYGGRYYWQIVNYVFDVDSIGFSGSFRGGTRQGYSKIGDEIKVKYLKDNPNYSKYIGRYVKVRRPSNNSSVYIEKPKFNYPSTSDTLK